MNLIQFQYIWHSGCLVVKCWRLLFKYQAKNSDWAIWRNEQGGYQVKGR